MDVQPINQHQLCDVIAMWTEPQKNGSDKCFISCHEELKQFVTEKGVLATTSKSNKAASKSAQPQGLNSRYCLLQIVKNQNRKVFNIF